MKWFDPYELRARIAPAIVVSLPIGITGLSLLALLEEPPDLLLQGSLALLVLIYTFSFVVRHCGRKIEPNLWASWDGPPSTRLMRWRDSTFDIGLKHQLHSAVEHVCRIKLSSKNEEICDPQTADEKITQAFILIRAVVRRDEPAGVWSAHNAEYGFHRNLLGSRVVWLIFSISGAIVCGTLWLFYKNDALIVSLALNVFLVVCSFVFGWIYLHKFALTSANRYAESIWNSFLVSAKSRHDGS